MARRRLPAQQSQELRNFLQQTNLMEIREILEKEQIDVEALKLLQDSDLEKLGIPMGYRIKLRAALGHAPQQQGGGGGLFGGVFDKFAEMVVGDGQHQQQQQQQQQQHFQQPPQQFQQQQKPKMTKDQQVAYLLQLDQATREQEQQQAEYLHGQQTQMGLAAQQARMNMELEEQARQKAQVQAARDQANNHMRLQVNQNVMQQLRGQVSGPYADAGDRAILETMVPVLMSGIPKESIKHAIDALRANAYSVEAALTATPIGQQMSASEIEMTRAHMRGTLKSLQGRSPSNQSSPAHPHPHPQQAIVQPPPGIGMTADDLAKAQLEGNALCRWCHRRYFSASGKTSECTDCRMEQMRKAQAAEDAEHAKNPTKPRPPRPMIGNVGKGGSFMVADGGPSAPAGPSGVGARRGNLQGLGLQYPGQAGGANSLLSPVADSPLPQPSHALVSPTGDRAKRANWGGAGDGAGDDEHEQKQRQHADHKFGFFKKSDAPDSMDAEQAYKALFGHDYVPPDAAYHAGPALAEEKEKKNRRFKVPNPFKRSGSKGNVHDE